MYTWRACSWKMCWSLTWRFCRVLSMLFCLNALTPQHRVWVNEILSTFGDSNFCRGSNTFDSRRRPQHDTLEDRGKKSKTLMNVRNRNTNSMQISIKTKLKSPDNSWKHNYQSNHHFSQQILSDVCRHKLIGQQAPNELVVFWNIAFCLQTTRLERPVSCQL